MVQQAGQGAVHARPGCSRRDAVRQGRDRGQTKKNSRTSWKALTEFVEHGRRVKADRSASARNRKRRSREPGPARPRCASGPLPRASPYHLEAGSPPMSSPSTRPPNPGDDAISSLWLGVRRLVRVRLLPAGPNEGGVAAVFRRPPFG